MSRDTFNFLLEIIKPELVKKENIMVPLVEIPLLPKNNC